MAPGAYEDVVLTLPAAATTSRSIWIAADDFGDLRGMTTESDEDNNVYDSGQALLGPSAGVDLVVTDVDAAGIVTDPGHLAVSGTVRATIRNQGDAAATGAFVVAFFEDADADGAYEPGVDVLLGQARTVGGLDGARGRGGDGIGERRGAVRGATSSTRWSTARRRSRRRTRPTTWDDPVRRAGSCRRWGCSRR